MPVVSPSRYNNTSSSTLSGSYRSTLTSSSSLDKPYYRTSSGTYVTSTLRSNYGDRTTEYRSRYTDVDGKRDRKSSLVEYRSTRAPSVTDSDSGISSRYRSDRSESRSRDLSTTRSESSKTSISDPLPRNPKRNVISTAALAISTADLYSKYSPANYIPLTQRLQQNNYGEKPEISRSKSISNDIGRPPAPDSLRASRKARNSTVSATIAERSEPQKKSSYKEGSPTPSYSKRASLTNGVKDTNGNEVPSVAEIRKRFDTKMTVTKLPTNDTRYPKTVDHYINQLKTCENGTSGYTKILPKDDKLVPIHLPTISNPDISMSKTSSEPASLFKPTPDQNQMSVSLTSKLPQERIASIKSQLDPNNPIGKILEKSTVIQVENGDADRTELRRFKENGTPKKNMTNDIEKQVKTPKHTSNFASYIQISQPIATGTSSNQDTNSEQKKIKYIDTEVEDESPTNTGFENKIFEHENYLMKRSTTDEERGVRGESLEEFKSMDTSTESTTSDLTEDSSPDTPSARRKLDNRDEDKTELTGARPSGAGGARRSTDRADSIEVNRVEKGSSHSSGLNGLRNIGNTCFMNSVLQCLSNTKPLLEYVVEDKHLPEINTTLSGMKGALIKAFSSLVKELWREGERDSVVNTTTFKSQVQRFAPRFMGYSQQDAQEFLRYLLEGLHEDVNRVTIRPKPILTEIDDNLSESAKATEAWSRYLRREESCVGDIFMGQLKSTLRCTHCHHDSVTFDPFWDLSLPIPSRTGNLKLQQCLQHFTREEELDGDEKPTCSKCGVRRKCLKWFTVQKFPQVLVLHLKRFSPTERFRGKLNVVVEFPISGLDMAPYAATRGQEATYDLYAVSNHSGTTYSGHYTAYCKHPYNGDWHEYNDSRVMPITSRNVVSSEAYVLFYELTRGSRG